MFRFSCVQIESSLFDSLSLGSSFWVFSNCCTGFLSLTLCFSTLRLLEPSGLLLLGRSFALYLTLLLELTLSLSLVLP